jgi:hypothetical protein
MLRATLGDSAQRCARHVDSMLRVMLGDICPLVNPWHYTPWLEQRSFIMTQPFQCLIAL